MVSILGADINAKAKSYNEQTSKQKGRAKARPFFLRYRPSLGYRRCCSRRNNPKDVCRRLSFRAFDDLDTPRIEPAGLDHVIEQELRRLVVGIHRRAAAIGARIDDHIKLCIRRILHLDHAIIKARLVLVMRAYWEVVAPERCRRRWYPANLGRNREDLAAMIVVGVVIYIKIGGDVLAAHAGRVHRDRRGAEAARNV